MPKIGIRGFYKGELKSDEEIEKIIDDPKQEEEFLKRFIEAIKEIIIVPDLQKGERTYFIIHLKQSPLEFFSHTEFFSEWLKKIPVEINGGKTKFLHIGADKGTSVFLSIPGQHIVKTFKLKNFDLSDRLTIL